MSERKITSDEKKLKSWKQKFEMDGGEMKKEWWYCVEDTIVDRFSVYGIQIG